MIVLLESPSGLQARQVHLFDQFSARIRAARLDRELAAGASPEENVGLALHAERLAAPSERDRLARALTHLVSASERRATTGGMVLCRARIRRARRELRATASRLFGPGPIGVRGVAQIRLLLADGAGPLYRWQCKRDLRGELAAATRAMDPTAS